MKTFILILLTSTLAYAQTTQPTIIWVNAGTTTQPSGIPGGIPLTPVLKTELLRLLTPPPPPYDQPPAGSIVVRIGQQPPKLVNNQVLALEKGGRATGTIELKGANVSIVPFGQRDLPFFELSSPTGSDACIFTAQNQTIQSLSITGLSLKPANPNADDRGEGIALRGTIKNLSLTDIWSTKLTHNLTLEGPHANVHLSRIRSTYAFGSKNKPFDGQGAYFAMVKGPFVVEDSLFFHNGSPSEDKDAENSNQYRHDIYQQSNCCPVTYNRCIIGEGTSAGLQARSPVICNDCSFISNGISVLAINSQTTLNNCGFAGTHLFKFGTGSWVGGSFIMSYAPARFQSCTFITNPRLPLSLNPSDKAYPNGWFDMSGKYKPHPEWAPQPGSTSFDNCTILTIPQVGDLFEGDSAPRSTVPPKVILQTASGLTQRPSLTPISVQYKDLVDKHLQGDVTSSKTMLDRIQQAR